MADVLSEHVAFEVACIDRMYLNVYVPRLQRGPALIGYLRGPAGLAGGLHRAAGTDHRGVQPGDAQLRP